MWTGQARHGQARRVTATGKLIGNVIKLLPLLRYAHTLGNETAQMWRLMYSPLEGQVVDNNFNLHSKHFHNLFLKYHQSDNNKKVQWEEKVTFKWQRS
jgi:hypothetical protein